MRDARDAERPALTTAPERAAPVKAPARSHRSSMRSVGFSLARVALITATPATTMRPADGRGPFRKLNGPPPYGPKGRK
jgi:hypothetical protein